MPGCCFFLRNLNCLNLFLLKGFLDVWNLEVWSLGIHLKCLLFLDSQRHEDFFEHFICKPAGKAHDCFSFFEFLTMLAIYLCSLQILSRALSMILYISPRGVFANCFPRAFIWSCVWFESSVGTEFKKACLRLTSSFPPRT